MSVAIARDAIGNVIVTGDGNTVAVTLTVIAADPRLRAPAAASADNPYRGLDAFRETDSAVFFGREDAVHKLWLRLHGLQRGSLRLLPIVGASGSGKSSLIRAGLLPELVRQPMDGMRKPTVLVLRPGAQPMQRLAEALATLAATGIEGVDAVHRAARGLADPDARVIVFVDQLEELFTECTSEPARAAFLATLAHAAAHADGVVSVVFAVRNDFAGALRGHDAFARALREQRFAVAPMTQAQLIDAIEKPAAALGHAWPGGLVENLVLQCEGRAGALPLLQFALKRLWPAHAAGALDAEWSSRLIEDYLVQVADALVEAGGADPAGHARILRRAFIAMVQLGAGTADTRRVARLSEIVARGETGAKVQAVLAPFVAPEARLIIASELDGEPAYELAHEALIGAWDQLRAWLGHAASQADAEGIRGRLRRQRRFLYAAEAWRSDGGALLRPPELETAEALRREHGDDLPPLLDDFIAASVRAWEAHDRTLRWLRIGALTVALIFALALATLWRLGQHEKVEADLARVEAEAQRASAQKSDRAAHDQLATTYLEQGRSFLLDGHPMKALAYLVAAREAGRDSRALRMLYARAAPFVPIATWVHPARVTSVAFGAAGERVLTVSEDHTARLWDARTGHVANDLGTGAITAVFSADGARVVTTGSDGVRVWDARTGKPVARLAVSGEIASAVLSADGARVATAGGALAQIWDAGTGRLVTALKHRGSVAAAAFSPDGTRVVTASESGAQVWDARTGQRVTAFAPSDAVTSAAFSPDGALVITTGWDDVARIWNVRTGQLAVPPLAHRDWVLSAAFSPDGTYAVTTSEDRTARVWDVRTGRSVGEPLTHRGKVLSAAFNADGTHVVTASDDDTARVWDTTTGAPVTSPFEHRSVVRAAAFSPDGARVITASDDGTARVWNAASGESVLSHRAQLEGATAMAFSPDGALAVTTSPEKAAQIWDLRTGEPATPPLDHGAPIELAAFSPDGNRVITTSWDKAARLWDVHTGERVIAPLVHPDKVLSAKFDRGGTRVVTFCFDHRIRVWDTRTGALVIELAGGPSMDATFSADGSHLVTTNGAPTAQIWDLRTGAVVATASDRGGGLKSADFSPDGTRVVTASDDDTARVWDARTGQPVTDPLDHRDTVWSAVFSPDGTRVATASEDRTARIWDAATGKPLGEPLEHTGTVWSAVFSPDGAFLVTDSQDNLARVWDAHTGQPVTEPLKHVAPNVSVMFSPDGNRLRIVGFDNVARTVWAWNMNLASGLLSDWKRHARCAPVVIVNSVLTENTADCP